MNTPTSTEISSALRGFLRGAAKQGDAMVVAVLGAIIALAGFLFLTFIYSSISAPQPISTRPRSFNVQQFEKVIGRIESRDEQLEDRLAHIPRTPFTVTLQELGE